jgi:hypothetical protein
MRRAATGPGRSGKDGGKASPIPAKPHAPRQPAGNQARLRKLERGGPAEAAADRLANRALRGPADVAAAPAKRPSSRPSMPGDLPKPVHRALAGSGQPLAPAVRASFEAGFGADLADVRVHAGPSAATAARSVAAEAFASGPNIVFGEGRYRPDTAAGRRLLAHELAHVVLGGPAPDGLLREPLGTAEILKRISAIETQLKTSSTTIEGEAALYDELESLQQQLHDQPVAQAAAKVAETKKRIQAVEQKLDTTSQTAKAAAEIWDERDDLLRDLSDQKQDLQDEAARDGRISRTHALIKDSDEDLKKLYLKVLKKSPDSLADWERKFDRAAFEQIVEARFGDQRWYLDTELERLQSAKGDERDRLFYHRLARAVPTPDKAADLIPMLKEAQWWAEADGSYSGMLRAKDILISMHRWLQRTASYENMDAHLGELPLSYEAKLFPGRARDEIGSLVMKLALAHDIGPAHFGGWWKADLTVLGAAQQYLEVLNDEKKLKDTPIPELHQAMGKGALVSTGILVGGPIAIGLGGGLVLEAAPAVAAFGGSAWTSANLAALRLMAWGSTVPVLGWAITNVDKSLPIGTFTINQGVKIYYMGLEGYLDSLKTPQGLAGLMYDACSAYQTYLDLRAPQPRTGTALATLPSAGSKDPPYKIIGAPTVDENGVGRVTVMHQPTGAVLHMTLDPVNNVVHVFDSSGQGFSFTHDFGGGAGQGPGAGVGAPSGLNLPPGRVIDVDTGGAAPPSSALPSGPGGPLALPPGSAAASAFTPPTPIADTNVELPVSPTRYVTPPATPDNPNPLPVATAPTTGVVAMEQRYNANPANIQYHENARVAGVSMIRIAEHADASPPGDLVSSARGTQVGAPGQAHTAGSVIPDNVGVALAPPGQGPVSVQARLHSENPRLQQTMPNAQSANNPTVQFNRKDWYLSPNGTWVESNDIANMGPPHMPAGGRDRGPTGLGEIPGMAAGQGPALPGSARPDPAGFTMSNTNPLRDDGTPSSQTVYRWGRPGDNLDDYDIDQALSGFDPFLKPYRPTPLLPGGGGSGPAPGPGGGGGAGGWPLTIVEPYAGPSLDSARDLQTRFPSALVIAGEGRIPPPVSSVSIFQAGGGVFHPEGLPPLSGPVDQVHVRFPLPNYKASEVATADYLQGVPLDVALDRAETLHNAGPYALKNLRPGGTMEVVFLERDIINDVDALTQIRFDAPDGVRYGFEIVSQSQGRVGDIAPHSGFGVVENRDTVVNRVILRKAPRRP